MTIVGKPVWMDCETCRDLPDCDWYDAFSSGGFKDGFSRLEKLERFGFRQKIVGFKNYDGRLNILGLWRCPLCHTFYLETGENCHDHYASYLMSIDRINDDEVFQELSSMKSKKAKEWLADLRAKMGKS